MADIPVAVEITHAQLHTETEEGFVLHVPQHMIQIRTEQFMLHCCCCLLCSVLCLYIISTSLKFIQL